MLNPPHYLYHAKKKKKRVREIASNFILGTDVVHSLVLSCVEITSQILAWFQWADE